MLLNFFKRLVFGRPKSARENLKALNELDEEVGAPEADRESFGGSIKWANLTSCFGESFDGPSDVELKNALKELFESRDDEHPDAWIECGSNDGPLYTLSIFSSGYGLYTKYSDVDMTEELETKRIEMVTEETGFVLWKKLLSEGAI